MMIYSNEFELPKKLRERARNPLGGKVAPLGPPGCLPLSSLLTSEMASQDPDAFKASAPAPPSRPLAHPLFKFYKVIHTRSK